MRELFAIDPVNYMLAICGTDALREFMTIIVLYFTLYIGSLKNFITIIHFHAWNVFLRSFEQCQEFFLDLRKPHPPESALCEPR
jgi:1-phosphatidylinositol-4-phosphate 5-kinase